MNTFTRYTLSALFFINAHMVMADNVITITNESQFNKEVLQSGKPAVVKVGAKWCGACTSSEGKFHKLSDEYPNVVFASLDSDQNDAIATRYNVQSLPTLLYFNNGKLVTSKVGYNKDQVVNTLKGMQSAPASEAEKKSPEQEQMSEQAQVSQPTKELAPEVAVEQPKPEAEAPVCLAQSESLFERVYNSTKDFFVNIGNTIRGWFK